MECILNKKVLIDYRTKFVYFKHIKLCILNIQNLCILNKKVLTDQRTK